MNRTLIFCRPLLATLLAVLTVFSATAEEVAQRPDTRWDVPHSPEPVLPEGATVNEMRSTDREVFRIREETRLLKAHAARQDALNELEESRLKLTRGTVTTGVAAGLDHPEYAARQPAISVPKLAEVWNEKKIMRAAVMTEGRQITLRTGDLWPGTAFHVKAISVRGVVLDNAQTIPVGGSL
ncbi:type IV pilus biogenesis protein PilP [Klebsiella quasivariicola]|uniref:type IV pilus biogenesis protein PilP n=1 Tax=Klebsiella quasivariicola TaxID=2026240 RepID=UPI001CCF255D|nr:type IV pilus biogenesis protein PilP [Klebsiella quasivariicola]MBZ9582956.1 type IV pilus biogenesis protein PilP [Klebsiella quasivariicola]